MPKVEISHNHKVAADEARKRIDSLNQELGAQYGLSSRWLSDTEARFERTGATGTIRIEPHRIHVHLDLSLAMLPIKGAIEKRIKDELAKRFTE